MKKNQQKKIQDIHVCEVYDMFRKLKPRRPSVVRKGDNVKVCHYYNGMKQCLGPTCFWQQVGICPIYNRVKAREMRKAK